jgi:imidazole glycerol phosphate synthase glutamine amidotransferase subunit
VEIVILDLGLNNINSVKLAFERVVDSKTSVNVVSQNRENLLCDLLILPGLGNFGAAMNEIRTRGFDNLIERNLEKDSKLVGICLGMQLLSSGSEESPGIMGLNYIPGSVTRLKPEVDEKRPNVGWAEVRSSKIGIELFSDNDRKDFYFVHSYEMKPDSLVHIAATTPYGSSDVVAAVLNRNVLGFQFHPEKSSKNGSKLISQTIKWAKNEI